MKIFKLIVLILTIALLSLIAASFLVNTVHVRNSMEKRISEKFKADASINGKIKILFMPYPVISIKDIELSNLKNYDDLVAKIKYIKIYPSIFSLITKNKKIDKIVIDKISLTDKKDESKTKENRKINEKFNLQNDKLQEQIVKESDSFWSTYIVGFNLKNIKKIIVKDASFSRENFFFKDINFSISRNNAFDILDLVGSFNANGIQTNFEINLSANKNKESVLVFFSDLVELKIKGKFHDTNLFNLKDSNFEGKFQLRILNLIALNKYFIGENNTILESNTPVLITGNLKGKKRKFTFDNIDIESEIIKGKGDLSLLLKQNKIIIDKLFKIEYINLDKVIIDNKKLISDVFINQNNYFLKNLFKNVDSITDLSIKKVIFFGDNVENIDLYIFNNKGNTLVHPVTIHFPRKLGFLRFSAVYNDKKKFNGVLYIEGNNLESSLKWLNIDPRIIKIDNKEYLAGANISLSDDHLMFNKVYLDFNDRQNLIFGDLLVNFIDKTINNKGKFYINNLSLNNASMLKDKLSVFLNKNLLETSLWLNRLSFNNDLSFDINNVNYNGNNFQQKDLIFRSSRGFLEVKNANLKSKNLDIKKIDMTLDLSQNIPIFNLSANIDRFYFDNSEKDLIDYFFDLSSLDRFYGKIDISIGDMKIGDDIYINNGTINGELENGKLNLTESNFDIYQGTLKYNGSITIHDTKIINGNFQLLGFNNRLFLKHLLNIEYLHGKSNLSAIVNSSAKNKKEFFNNLYSKLKFVSSNVVNYEFGLDDLMFKTARSNKYKDELDNINDLLFNNSKPSVFQNVSGILTIDNINNHNSLNIKMSSPGINAIVSGKFDIENKMLNAISNIIFLTGTLENPTPLNIAISSSGELGSLKKEVNDNQINQYLRNLSYD